MPLDMAYEAAVPQLLPPKLAGSAAAPAIDPYSSEAKESKMGWMEKHAPKIVGGLCVLIIGGFGWEINKLDHSNETLRTDMNANNVALIAAIGTIHTDMAATNGRIDTLGARFDAFSSAVVAGQSQTNQKLDQLIQNTNTRQR